MVQSFFIDTPATIERIKLVDIAPESAVEATVADISKAFANAIVGLKGIKLLLDLVI
jgi:hypothetical protein